jgi:hypothetical protein
MDEPISSGKDVNFAKIVRTWQIESLIGKVLLIVETMGLNASQEKSAKSLIKQSIWLEFNEGTYISPGMIKKVGEENESKGFVNLTQ